MRDNRRTSPFLPFTAPPLRFSRLLLCGTALALALAGGRAAASASESAAGGKPQPPALVNASITDLVRSLANGDTTSTALVQGYLARIEAYDNAHDGMPGLGAVISVNPNALALARTRDDERAAGKLRGPLHGVPIIIKDNIGTADMPTTNGSIAFATYRNAADATVVARLRDAGAIVIAKANLSEFAWTANSSESSIRGHARNPYDPSRTTTGSSGGTAAAVAASFAPGGLGSDTWGSIRNPSNHQALVGLRPTHGLVSLAGVTAQISVLDTVGPMTKTVSDAALLLDTIAGTDPRDAYTAKADRHIPASYLAGLSDTALKGKRIGVVTNGAYWGEGKSYGAQDSDHQQVVALIKEAIAELERQGATVVEVAVPDTVVGRGWKAERYWMDRFLATEQAAWPAGLAALTAPSAVLTVSDYLKDGRAIESIRASADDLLSQADLTADDLADDDAREAKGRAALQALFDRYRIVALAYPSDPAAALPLDDADAFRNTNHGLASSLGVPAITVPAGFTRSGLPAGLQLLGLPYSEAELLAYAYDYEQATLHWRAPTSTPELPGPPRQPH